MKTEDKHPVPEGIKVEIQLTKWQSEIFDKVIESVREINKGKEITREIVLTDLCTTYIANEGQRLIKQG